MPLSPAFQPATFHSLPGWGEDAQEEAFPAFRLSAFRVLDKPYRTGGLGIDCASFGEAYAEARNLRERIDRREAREFFERHFVPCKVVPDNRDSGFVTGFYEPIVKASSVKTHQFRWPIYGRPSDLVDVDDSNRPAGMDPYLAFGCQSENGIGEYFDRADIEDGALAGRGLELAWLEDQLETFLIHVQGAARLEMPDGTVRRFTYAAKSGQRFTGPGSLLVQTGKIDGKTATMETILAWFRANSSSIDNTLRQNRSFIFFREQPVQDAGLGPVAAAKVPLRPGRSMAVDRLAHVFGTPFYIHAPTLEAFGGSHFSRLMIAQDTGSAIVGHARGDLFAGSGREAGEIAGVVRHDADFYALIPRRLVDT
ncbi:transglycosylase [Mesorhizobium sp. NBSH29]|uniref:murein transglycosylase A n=1 Tax=Mesorhizobium sp. NBSH29 TaxID=2654249 RepID=UPI0018966011|nr:murein transglycosylase A [Mesorhizobium sp. NBSH29]QPC86080.1 transglycosylase [Mesorhizobium sp. NBSH29]